MELAHLKKIFNGFNTGIIVLDEGLKVYFWNHWMVHHTGITSEEITTKLLPEHIKEVNTKILKRKIRSALMLHSPSFYPESLKNNLFAIADSTGKETNKLMRQSVTIIPYANTKKVIITIIDKSQEYNYTQQLYEKAEAIKELNYELEDEAKIIDTHISSIRVDKQEHISSISSKLCEILTCAPDDFIGKNFKEYFQPWYHETSNKDFEKRFPAHLILIANSDTEPIYLFISNKVTRDNGENLLLLQDITDYIQLQYQNEQILQQSRSAAMGEMISIIAHQWRQPLSAITGLLTDITVKAHMEKLEKDHMLDNISQAEKIIIHMSDTINDFRNYFKPSKDKETISLETLYLKVSALYQTLLKEKNIKISCIGNVNQELFIHVNELIQILLSLIQNSLDAFVENDIKNRSITIETSKEEEGFITITVSDNAGGIPKNLIHKVFDPYFSTKSKNGTGLGLYMTKKLLTERFHGDIHVTSSDDCSIFTLTISTKSDPS